MERVLTYLGRGKLHLRSGGGDMVFGLFRHLEAARVISTSLGHKKGKGSPLNLLVDGEGDDFLYRKQCFFCIFRKSS
jgi:hypothetical protein